MNKKMILPLLTVFLFSSCHKAENETLFTESIPDTESIVRTTTAESSISVSEPSETVTIAVNENASLEEQMTQAQEADRPAVQHCQNPVRLDIL